MIDRSISGKVPPRRVVVLTSGAISLPNFRGPLIRSMVDAGVEVFALAPDYDDKVRNAVRALGATPVDITLERTGLKPLRDLRDAANLYRVLRHLEPDLVFSYFIKPVIYGSMAARLAGVPRRFALVAGLGYVFTPDGRGNTARRRILRAVASSLYRMAFRACDAVFLQNGDDVRELVDAGLLAPAKVRRLAGSGVDLDILSETPPVVTPPTFLLMGRLLREKGIVEFAEAARKVRVDHPEARFVLLGGTDPNPGGLTAEEVERMATEGGIEWHGHVSDVQPYIVASSVYVLPSYREGKPRSTQEAMAIGRAVITTDAPGCRDTVIDGVNGFLVPVRDADALADAMRRFLHRPQLILEMGQASRRLAEELFDVHTINRVILAEFGIPPARQPNASLP